jgi:succinate dehydrogenase flavin-adding protein (antitoxin of CptAB toxin-antitoxin module)
MTDPFVKKVIEKYQERSEAGIKKYNNTLERNDLSFIQWLTHLQEELMDATLYIEKLKAEAKKNT